MSIKETAFLSFLFSGILALLAGLMLIRLNWRPDIPPYGRRTSFFEVTLHPEEYVKAAPLRLIRSLNYAGVLLLAAAAGLVVLELLRVTLGV